MTPNEVSSVKAGDDNSTPDSVREEERADVTEPDAPTAEEENEGMNTVLDANPVTGVQRDASDD